MSDISDSKSIIITIRQQQEYWEKYVFHSFRDMQTDNAREHTHSFQAGCRLVYPFNVRHMSRKVRLWWRGVYRKHLTHVRVPSFHFLSSFSVRVADMRVIKGYKLFSSTTFFYDEAL